MRGLWRRLLELVRPAQLDRESVEELVAPRRAAGRAQDRQPASTTREARRQALAEVGTVRVRARADRRRPHADSRSINWRAKPATRRACCGVRLASRCCRSRRWAWASAPARSSSRWSTASCCGRCRIRSPIAWSASSTPIRRPASIAPAWPAATSTTGAGAPPPSTASPATTRWAARVSIDADAEVLITAQVSDDFFPLLRVPPAPRARLHARTRRGAPTSTPRRRRSAPTRS